MAFYCLCLLIHTTITAPFYTGVMRKNTNFTLIAFTGQQEPAQTTFPSVCSPSCLFGTICSRLPRARAALAPCGTIQPLAGGLGRPKRIAGSQPAPKHLAILHTHTPRVRNRWKCFNRCGFFFGESPTVKSLTNRISLHVITWWSEVMDRACADEFHKGSI